MKKIFLHVQKTYTCYTIAVWFLWSLILILTQISGTAFEVKNEQLFFALVDVSTIIHWFSLIPVIPVLWLLALVNSIRNKNCKHIVFNVISIAFSVLLWFQFFINHIVNMWGGV